ncbi:hypothetical protein [Spirulina subsalsa]|uniref:hypothetical protein n=1 Tax=Spirulina subsalsa TaxID=54311 RepID=UPI0002EBDDEC|nr:hypothetical protein [Spirulina subsalsa]
MTFLNSLSSLTSKTPFEKLGLSVPRWGEKQRTHDYRKGINRDRYIFEQVPHSSEAYITAYNAVPRTGDHLLIPVGEETLCYRVAVVESYYNPNFVWTALLIQVRS